MRLLSILALASFFLFAEEDPLGIPFSGRIDVPRGSNLFFFADWLYWQATETGLSYAIDNPDYDIFNDTFMGTGEIANPSFEWRSGFRTGVGYNLPHDNWDTQFTWTWYEGKATGSVDAFGDPTIFPSLVHPNIYNSDSIVACSSANSDLLIHLNMIDLDLGRHFKAGKAVSIRPYLGLRSAWINQNYDINYEQLYSKDPLLDEDLFLSPKLVLNSYDTFMKNNFWGIGMLGGVSSDWDLGYGISLFGQGSLSLLYGFFDILHTESFTNTNGAWGTVISDSNNFHTSRAIADICLGVQWTSPCFRDRALIRLKAAWEQHLFFSQNQFIRFTDGQNWGTFVQNQGDLDFQGWSASLQIYF